MLQPTTKPRDISMGIPPNFVPSTTPSPAPVAVAGQFETTLWSVVLEAGSHETSQSRPALEQLCRAYWHPLYCYARRRGYQPADAQDLVQGLFKDLIAGNAFHRVSPDQGRFRAFLLAAMNHCMAGDYDRRQAAKRGGGQVTLSLNEPDAEARFLQVASGSLSPEQEFDRRWALAVLARALNTLADEQAASGRGEQFAQLRPFLTDTAQRQDYSQVAGRLGLAPNAVAVAVHRLRQRYQQLVRAEVAGTVGTFNEVEGEMQSLMAAMRS